MFPLGKDLINTKQRLIDRSTERRREIDSNLTFISISSNCTAHEVRYVSKFDVTPENGQQMC